MSITTIDKIINNMDDGELLDIYTELQSGKVPATSYAHDFCRKINRMIDGGEISVKQDGFRHIYLPSLRKLVYKEMAKRYADYLQRYKTIEVSNARGTDDMDEDEEDVEECAWCSCEFDSSELVETDLGKLCDRCIAAIRSRGKLCDRCIAAIRSRGETLVVYR